MSVAVVEAEQILVTRGEAARLLSMSVSEIDNLRRAGHLIAKRSGSRVFFLVAELQQWARSLPADIPQ